MLQIQEFVKPADHSKPRVIGICPARGGSTRLPDKNMRMFAGRPLIAWTCIQAMNALTLDEFWVTSDSDRILEVADKLGAKCHKRENESDDAPGWVPYLNLLEKIANPNDIFVGLFATSPQRRVYDIDNAVKKWFASPDHNDKFLISVEKIHEDFRWRVVNEDYAVPMPNEYNDMSRYCAVVQVCTPKYYEEITRQAKDAYYIPYFVEQWQSPDINEADQLRYIEFMFYDQILSEGLNPYEVYRKGGLKT